MTKMRGNRMIILILAAWSIALINTLGCVEQAGTENQSSGSDLDRLTSPADHTAYLLQIADADQKWRNGQSNEIILKHGEQSEAYQAFIKQRRALDALNLKKIEAYLDRFGYPDKDKVGERAVSAPWLVIHHADSYEDRKRNFDYLYEAYRSTSIDSGKFLLYLEGMYQIKHGHRLDNKSAFRSSERIDRLINLMNLSTTSPTGQIQ